jgi:septal ring factor EnvC (AmiA/AmiB activator)
MAEALRMEPQMPDPPPHTAVEAAIRRLQAALDAIETAFERQRDARARDAGLADRVHALNSDRARLADELDQTTARSKQLESVNREIAQRIDNAMATIRAVISAHDR